MSRGSKLRKTLSAVLSILVVCVLMCTLVLHFEVLSYADETERSDVLKATGEVKKTEQEKAEKNDKTEGETKEKNEKNEAAKKSSTDSSSETAKKSSTDGSSEAVKKSSTDNSSEAAKKSSTDGSQKAASTSAAQTNDNDLIKNEDPDNDTNKGSEIADKKDSAEKALDDSKKNEKKEKKGTRAEHGDVITNIEALLEDGSGPLENVQQWQTFRLNAEFDLSGKDVKAGDTTTITLPEKLRFGQTSGFEIKDSSGNVVANAVIDGTKKTITLIYTDYAENHSDVRGSFFFYARIDREKVDGPEDITLVYDVDGNTIIGDTIHFEGIPDPTGRYLSKSGYQAGNDKRTIQFQLAINTIQKPISNLKVTDQLKSEGFTIIPDSFEIRKGKWKNVHGDWQMPSGEYQVVTNDYTINLSEDGKSFSIDMGNISAEDGFYIYYKARASYDLVDGEVIRNTASVNGDEAGSNPQTVETVYYEAGGSAEGYVYKIVIKKEDENGSPLAGAVFDVIRESSGAVAGTITTDASGEGELSGLLKDRYRLVEVAPPAGFVLLDDPVIVEIADFNSDKIAIKTIENKAITIDIPVKKQWVGEPAKSAVVNLSADGVVFKEAELSEDNDWKYTFSDLPKYDSADGHEIVYDVEEQNIEGYVSGKSGTAEDGFIITNTISGKVSVPVTKVWKGTETDKVVVNLLADGTKTDSIVLSKENNWQHTFADLDKYKDGKEIAYLVEEEKVDGYEVSIAGNAQDGFVITNTKNEEVTPPPETEVTPPPKTEAIPPLGNVNEKKDPAPSKNSKKSSNSKTAEKRTAKTNTSNTPRTDDPVNYSVCISAMLAAGLVMAFLFRRRMKDH